MSENQQKSEEFDDDEVVRISSPQIESMAPFEDANNEASSETTEEDDDLNREDIVEAQALPDETRQSLHYGTKERLLFVSEKVRARPVIDEEISERLQMIDALLEEPKYEQFHSVLKKSQVNIKDAMVKAEVGGASLKRAIEVADQVLARTKQTCDLSTQIFELPDDTTKHLTGFETLEHQRVESMRALQMDDAEQIHIECLRLLDDAVESSKKNVDEIVRKKREVEEAKFLEKLQQTLTDVEQTIQDEIHHLNLTNDNCQADIENTRRSQTLHKERREAALEKFETKDKELAEEIKNNEEEQEKLRLLLQELQRKQEALKADKEKRLKTQRRADQVQSKVREELEKMEDEFQELAKQSQASLQVMLLMSEASQAVLNKCIEYVKSQEQRLLELDIKALSQQREALAFRAVSCKLQMKDSEDNISYLAAKVSTLGDELRQLAMRNLKTEVNVKKEERSGYKTQLKQHKKDKSLNESKLIGINMELQDIDARLEGLGQVLMSVDDMAADRQARIQMAFNAEDPFSSLTSETD